MAHPSPLRTRHLESGASLLPYGPPDTDIELPETFDALELEYAALRKRCVLIDRPDRAVVRVTGVERIDFLNNMLTQELKPGGTPVKAGTATDSFWLNRKGRIDADIRVLQMEDQTLFDLDAHSSESTVASLDAFLFSEDCQLVDATAELHLLQLIGPTSVELFQLAAGAEAPLPDTVAEFTLAGVRAVVSRSDELGVPALSMFVSTDDAGPVHDALLEMGAPSGLAEVGQEDGHVDDDGTPASRIRLRRAGWHALNIARIEAGLPRFMLDFGPNNLPGETGVLRERVSFTKGCYLGQEVVARMDALGHPKQILVAITCEKKTLSDDRLDPVHPVTGSHVFARGDASKPIGAVTSATLSPSRGNTPVCFAQVKWGSHEAGTELTIQAEGLELDAVVHDGLRFV